MGATGSSALLASPRATAFWPLLVFFECTKSLLRWLPWEQEQGRLPPWSHARSPWSCISHRAEHEGGQDAVAATCFSNGNQRRPDTLSLPLTIPHRAPQRPNRAWPETHRTGQDGTGWDRADWHFSDKPFSVGKNSPLCQLHPAACVRKKILKKKQPLPVPLLPQLQRLFGSFPKPHLKKKKSPNLNQSISFGPNQVVPSTRMNIFVTC